MEWVKVTTESVRSHMAVELIEAYDKWIVAYPEKAGRLDEIVANVRTEFRDAIASVPRNRLNEDPETLPVSAVRHCENICMYEMAMEVGVQITQDGRTLLTNAQIYLRQIPYGRYRFYEDEEDTGVPLPSATVPGERQGRALGPLVALLLGAFLWCLPARAAWIKPGNETTYVPVNYEITEQSLNGHLAGIDSTLGWLSDTNSLYGDLVALPAVVYNLMDVLKSQALYGEYREDAGAWVATSQTNVIIFGTMAVNRLVVREDGATIHGNAEILDGGLDVDGDVTLSSGLVLGGVRRDSWPADPTGAYLPAHTTPEGNWVVDDSNEGTCFPNGAYGPWGEWLYAHSFTQTVRNAMSVDGFDEQYFDDDAGEMLERHIPGRLGLNGTYIESFGELTNGFATTNEVAAAVSAYAAQTNNPNHVTLQQALDATGSLFDKRAYYNQLGFGFDDFTDKLAYLEGYGSYLSFEESLLQGNGFGFLFTDSGSRAQWRFESLLPVTWNGVALATTSAVAAVSSRVAHIESDYLTSDSLQNYATTGTLAAVSGRVDAIEADYVVSSDIAGFASTQDVASVERRVEAAEDAIGEYWCKWTASSMSASEINWIPTNWPARTVHCLVVFNTSGATNIIAFPDWSPAEPHTLDLWLYKTASGAGVIQTADGTTAVSATGTSGSYSKCVLSFAPAIGWFIARSTITQPVVIVGDTRLYPTVAGIPEDSTFAPVINPSTLLTSPSLQSIRPQFSQIELDESTDLEAFPMEETE